MARPQLSPAGERYLRLLAGCLTRELFLDQECRDIDLGQWPGGPESVLPILRENGWRIVRREVDSEVRAAGRDWPPTAETMVGRARLHNVMSCARQVIEEGVPGDFLEAGVWRGGVTILLRGVLAAYDEPERRVWVADSFAGLPVPDPARYPADAELDWSHVKVLAIGADDVRANFARYDLLDDRVRFLEGWFADTLPSAPVDQLALLRLDGDLYQSTWETLEALEARVSPGGYVIVDDYFGWASCQKAVDDYREQQGIDAPIERIDWTGAFWRKPPRPVVADARE